MLLYKFRSVSGEAFRYSQDIFVNRRLYVPTARELNDPNEGIAIIDIKNQYRVWGNQLEERNRRHETRLCAMTQDCRSPVLWAHYANDHRGICLELDTDTIDTSDGVLKPVFYSNRVPALDHDPRADGRWAFLNKTEEWAYEKEWRYISKNSSPFLGLTEMSIRRVLLGARFNSSDRDWVKFWIANYTTARSVPIIQMMFASTDYTLYEEGEMKNRIVRLG